MRHLFNPDSVLRSVQYRINTEILEKIEIPDYIHAFEKGRSIPDMARQHVGKDIVVSLDLENFFPSIKQRHLFKIFSDMGFGELPARTLSELCTYKSFVPQGALTSPKLSNIVTATTFGPEVKQLCDEFGVTVTIYADDITISIPHDVLPETNIRPVQLARHLIRSIHRIVYKYGFKINAEKTKIMRNYSRQYVCGVVVNEKTNLQKKERLRLRAILHNCKKNGIESEALKINASVPEFRSTLMGRINWFSQLNPEAGDKMKEQLQAIPDPQEEVAPLELAETTQEEVELA